jgi:hypothetical protein
MFSRIPQVFAALVLVGLLATASPCATRRNASQAAPRLSLDAAGALFVHSDLQAARVRAAAALKANPANIQALFVEMEAAALEADSSAELEAALRLCELKQSGDDVRVSIAAAHILEMAANTPQFRAAVPRIQKLIAAGRPQTNYFRAALVAAAADGVPGLSLLELSRASGLLTDWRIVGPLGRYRNVAFDRRWGPEDDGMAGSAYDNRAVESFRFEDGDITLPDYFGRHGVFYAAADVDIASPGEWRVRIESGGTLELFVDGASVLKKDDRLRVTPEIASAQVRLTAGTHRLLVKFLPSATPFRMAVLPYRELKEAAKSAIAFAPEAAYVHAAASYWTGDYSGTIAQLAASNAEYPSAVADFLAALAWSRAAPDSREERSFLDSVLRAAPSATAAEHRLAEAAFSGDRIEEALRRVRRVVEARPEFVPARELMAELLVRLNWRTEARTAMQERVRLHPSCAALREAARFFSTVTAYEQSAEMAARLQGCEPGSLDHAQALSDSGRHADAANAAAAVVRERPLDRAARAMLVRELAVAGQAEAAKKAAEELAALAPNAERFRRLAAQAGRSLSFDEPEPRGRDFAGQDFYTPFRRDVFSILKLTADRRFSGGPAVMLLHDRVVRLAADGSTSLYVHKITRLLNRDGIVQYGEVSIPANAELLELRTLKADGAVAEPEFSQHKATISMPALAPGDAIEQEYVVRYSGGVESHPDAFHFTFGSFAAPMLYSRFVVLSAAAESSRMQVVSSGNVPNMQSEQRGETIVRTWARDDIPQSTEEAAMPRTDILPTVRVVASAQDGWGEVRDYYRDILIEAARIGPYVEEAARQIAGATSEARARALYRMVSSRIRKADAAFDADVPGAEESLANRVGSRTAALLAIARAAGISADLLIARQSSSAAPLAPMPQAYTLPLVIFHLEERYVAVDAEADGLAFGALPPGVEHADALFVPVDSQATAAAIRPVPGTPASDHSVAEGDVTVDEGGGLWAKLTIRMGAWRSAQMRSILAGIEPAARNRFFEQLALRIFAGTTDASGEVRNESEPDRPLELTVTCRAPHFVNLSGTSADMEQLVPALGLRKLYANMASRKFPLYIDTPLFETATFRVHLPKQVRVAVRTTDLQLESEFGSYSVRFRQLAPNEFELERGFRIPVQVVSPDKFPAFSRFANRIDEVERQRFVLEKQLAGKSGRRTMGSSGGRPDKRTGPRLNLGSLM